MSAIRRMRKTALVALAATGLMAAAAAPAAQAETGTVGGLRLTSCPGDIPTDIGLFRHGLSCKAAMRAAEAGANTDRRCPRGWRVRTGVRMAGVNPRSSGYPALTLCSRRAPKGSGQQAFTYFLPTG